MCTLKGINSRLANYSKRLCESDWSRADGGLWTISKNGVGLRLDGWFFLCLCKKCRLGWKTKPNNKRPQPGKNVIYEEPFDDGRFRLWRVIYYGLTRTPSARDLINGNMTSVPFNRAFRKNPPASAPKFPFHPQISPWHWSDRRIKTILVWLKGGGAK